MRWKPLTVAALAALLAAGLTSGAPSAEAAPLTQVLVFSKTAGFRHSSIPQGVAAVQRLGAANGFAVTATEDAGAFTASNLARYQAVVFMSTTGDVLNTAQQTAFQQYVEGGGGYVGVHAAADTEYDWPWYGALLGGAYFSSHPAIQQATVRITDPSHPSVSHLPATWTRTDEWYNYRANPRPNVRVLATLDESTYSGGTMGADHPITWCRTVGNGRAWYTGLGHTEESYADPNYTQMLLGGIRVAAQAVAANCAPGASQPPQGTIVSLRSRANNQFVSVAADGRLIANRGAAGTAEQFERVALPNGNVALRSRSNNRFVCAENAGASPLVANRASAGSWETFQIVTNADGTTSLRATVNNRYVAAENGGSAPLIADRTAIGLWERFDLVTS